MEEEKLENLAEISWEVPEYEEHQRPKSWYIWASVVVAFLLFFALFNGNYLFSIIIVLSSFIIIFHDGKSPDPVDVSIGPEGIKIGRSFYNYDILKDFSVIFKPEEDVKSLYFEFKNPVRQRLSIPIMDQDPLHIRDYLLKYLSEDLERNNAPLSENLSRVLKV